jgi:hypothetical protein
MPTVNRGRDASIAPHERHRHRRSEAGFHGRAAIGNQFAQTAPITIPQYGSDHHANEQCTYLGKVIVIAQPANTAQRLAEMFS